jgi:hypothetical protein
MAASLRPARQLVKKMCHHSFVPKGAKNRAVAAADAGIDPRFAPIAAAFRGDPAVTSGRMMSAFGLKVHGRIFAMFPRGRFVAKLPKARVDALVAAGQGDYFDPGHGRKMKEWIAMDGHEARWLLLAKEAYRFVSAGQP